MANSLTNEQADNIKYRKDYQVSNFLIDNVFLTIELFEGYSLVTSRLIFAANPESKLRSPELKLNGTDLELISIELDGQTLNPENYRLHSEYLIIANCPEQFELQTQVKIYPEQNTSLEGLYQSSGKYCTQCEAEGFRKITYYLDRPDVMSIFEVRIEGDKSQFPYLMSNGNRIDSGDLPSNRHYAVWHDPFKKPSYLFALCAGDYDLLEDNFTTMSGREVLLQIFVDKGKLEQCHHAMESLKLSMKWDEDVFGLEYDLDIYMIVAVGDFNMGAMENKGLNVFNTKYVLASQATATDQDFEDVEAVIGHEYFHNWTGNRVTCRDWFQLSLKEGLTVFRDQQFTADQTDHAVKRIEDVKIIRSHQFAEDAGPMAHSIRPDSYLEMNNFYTVTVYNKGAEIIRMYHTLLGKDGFRKGMDLYFQRHDGEAVTCEDFIRAMEDANHYPLKQFRRWYSQAGTPQVNVTSDYDEASSQYRLHFEQSTAATPGQETKEPFHIPIRIGLLISDGTEIPLQLADCSAESKLLEKDILHFTRQKQTFVFEHVSAKPIPSLLRNFSAPINMEYRYSDEELSFLLAHDLDPFNQWEAGQRLYSNVIWNLYQSAIEGDELLVPDMLLEAIQSVLNNDSLNGRFKALALALPELKALIETRATIKIDRLLLAYDFLTQQIAERLEFEWEKYYQLNHQVGSFSQSPEAIAKRALSSRCLQYLAHLDRESSYQLLLSQIESANNMTDAISAFKYLMHSKYENKAQVAETFYQKWQSEELVLDKWLSVLATDPSDNTIENVKQLTKHSAFDKANPNKVRALIGSFAGANMHQFHRQDGQGYQFLSAQIKDLYNVNPQVAARLTGAFNRWKKFDENRQLLMKAELEIILNQPELSKDVYEIASKALK